MKTFVAFLKFHCSWLVYLYAIRDDKLLHALAHLRGRRCVSVTFRLFHYVACFDLSRPPQDRNWLTWPEYRARWHPIHGTFSRGERRGS